MVGGALVGTDLLNSFKLNPPSRKEEEAIASSRLDRWGSSDKKSYFKNCAATKNAVANMPAHKTEQKWLH